MSNNFKRRSFGYFNTVADMVAAKAGQNMVAVAAGFIAIGDGGGGIFMFRRSASLFADGINVFNATGAGGSSPFWVRVTDSTNTDDFTVLAVRTSPLAAYTRTTNTITANANGVISASFDGATVQNGDVFLLPEGIAAADSDAGPWLLQDAGGASTPFILKRPSWWMNGTDIPEKKIITVKHGNTFSGTQWMSWVTSNNKLVGTDAPLLFPKRVMVQTVLVNGTATITSVPVRSSNESRVDANSRQVANTSAATDGGYHATVAGANGITPGNLGTASVVIQATVAAGTINAADLSTLSVVIEN
jgi:hypothetical protein